MEPTEKQEHDEINKNKSQQKIRHYSLENLGYINKYICILRKTRKGPFHMYTVQYMKQLLYILKILVWDFIFVRRALFKPMYC